MMENLNTSVFSGSGSGSGSGNMDLNSEQNNSIVVGIVQITLCALGLLGNTLVAFVILVLKEYNQSVTNWYVLQLTVADLCFLATIPFKIAESRRNAWVWPVGMCKFNESLLFLNYYSSILFLTIMSIDRYLVVCYNTSSFSQKLRKTSSARNATLVIWIISIVLCTPIFIYSGVNGCRCRYDFAQYQSPAEKCSEWGLVETEYLECCINLFENQTEMDCSQGFRESDGDLMQLTSCFGGSGDLNMSSGGGLNVSGSGSNYDQSEYNQETLERTEYEAGCSNASSSSVWFAFVYWNFFGVFVLPFLIMLFCYSCIIKSMMEKGSSNIALKESRKEGNTWKGGRKKKMTKNERVYRRATYLCIAYVTIFTICWLPFHSVHIAKLSGIKQSEEFCSGITSAVFALVVLNSVVNPCVYNIAGKRFLHRLRKSMLTIKGGVAGVAESISSSGYTAHYKKTRKRQMNSNSSSVTATTKIYKGKSEMKSSADASQTQGSTEL